jgi:serine/threonine protein kinase
MGEVYRAVDQRLGREVALKMLPIDVQADADWQTRLLREAQAASALHHPGIVTLFDIASADGRSFLVLELVKGERFSDLAARGLPWAKAFELVASVAESMAAAHALGILHRDIKSDNLMVTARGQTKVLDFGLASCAAITSRRRRCLRAPIAPRYRAI